MAEGVQQPALYRGASVGLHLAAGARSGRVRGAFPGHWGSSVELEGGTLLWTCWRGLRLRRRGAFGLWSGSSVFIA